LSFVDQLAVEVDQPQVAVFVADIDSGDGGERRLGGGLGGVGWGVCFARIASLPDYEPQGTESSPEARLTKLQTLILAKLREHERVREREVCKLGDLVREWNDAKLRRQRLANSGRSDAAADNRIAELAARMSGLSDELASERLLLGLERVQVEGIDGTRRALPISTLREIIEPNRLGWLRKLGLYLRRWWDFLTLEPRESNTEGGVFPAIFGTVLMVFLMTFAVTPLGVLAALYLREYARHGRLVQLVRIAVNNLAGVPSIVFGVFGLGFFIYLIGSNLDEWLFADRLPTPTFGTGGMLWAALTLALLTVPVVIVATEEGLAAVPRAAREGSMALGATKWETLRHVVLPAAMPGILTGVILAVARAAGEVAPLMLVGVVKMAPELPFDHHFPFLHLERKFMHLGFHIYDVGLQSPNIEAAKPLVYATALLLVLLVAGMNLFAIAVRNRLRRQHAQHAV
jgi:phosphate transport system permease protein